MGGAGFLNSTHLFCVASHAEPVAHVVIFTHAVPFQVSSRAHVCASGTHAAFCPSRMSFWPAGQPSFWPCPTATPMLDATRFTCSWGMHRPVL